MQAHSSKHAMVSCFWLLVSYFILLWYFSFFYMPALCFLYEGCCTINTIKGSFELLYTYIKIKHMIHYTSCVHSSVI